MNYLKDFEELFCEFFPGKPMEILLRNVDWSDKAPKLIKNNRKLSDLRDVN